MTSLRNIAIASALVTLVAGLMIALAASVAILTDLFLLCFLGVLFAVFLVRLSGLLGRVVPVHGGRLAIVVAVLLLLLVGVTVLFGVQIEGQISRATRGFDDAAQRVRQYANQHPLARTALQRVPFAGELLWNASENQQPPQQSDSAEDPGARGQGQDNPDGGKSTPSAEENVPAEGAGQPASGIVGKALQLASRLFSTTFNILTSLVLVFFVGLFLAADPLIYREGIVKLVPPAHRRRAREILNELAHTLWHWLIGVFGTMTITGGGTAIALWLLGVPLAMTLGLLTGLLAFVPNFGPAMALVAAAMVALPQGLTTVGLVVAIFLGFQLLESNVITPLIQQHQVSIPPALLLAWQLLLGVACGFLGLIVATPLLACLIVLIQRLYLEEVLDDRTPLNPSACET